MRPTAPGSFWLDRDPASPRPPLTDAATTDVVVVGGGIAGAFATLELARGGADAICLEGDRIARGATGRNAGFLLAEAAETYAELLRTHGLDTARAVRAAGLLTRAAVTEVAARDDVALRITGSLRLAADAAEDADFAASAKLLAPEVEHLGRTQVPPAYRALDPAGGLVDPGDGEVHPLRLARAVFARAEAAGAFVFERSPVAAIEASADGVVVRTPSGSVTARAAIVTTNAWIPSLLPRGPAVRPVRAQMLAARVDPLPAFDRPVYYRRGADYWRTLADGTLLLGGLRALGGAAEETDDARPASPVQDGLDALLARLVGPDARVRVIARWAGTMGFTPDGLPAAGLAPGHDRVHVLGGFNGHGMGWGAGLARALAQGLLGQASPLDPAFDPSRPALFPRGVSPGPAR